MNADEKEGNVVRRRGRPRKARNLEGKKLFDGHESSEEDSISDSDQNDQEEDDDEEADQPLIHTFRASASKLRSMRIARPESTETAKNNRYLLINCEFDRCLFHMHIQLNLGNLKTLANEKSMNEALAS